MTTTYTSGANAARSPGPIVSREDYKQTPKKEADAAYWQDELKGSMDMLKRWHRQADRIQQLYLDMRTSEASSSNVGRESPSGKFKLNLFYSNTHTQMALLYGRLPKVDVSRRHNDANDDRARVAALIMERVLNTDIEDNASDLDAVLRATLEDRMIPGLGVARVRYDATFRPDSESADDNTQNITERVLQNEACPLDYYHWRDVLWSWARTPKDLRWMAFRNFLTKDEMRERYGDAVADNQNVEYKVHKMTTDNVNNDTPDIAENNDNWLRTEVWEIWDRKDREKLQLSFGAGILERESDPLGLDDFFPAPPFFMANPTTSLYKPTPDWHLVQDLYNEIDKLQTRIAIITEAVKVVGVYDKSNDGVKRMLKEGVENDLIPVDNWALFAEKGGLKGTIDWFPIEDVVNALLNLRQLRDETIELLYQVTGMADVMRGQLANQYEGVGQTDTKTEFASIRMQYLQEQFATFATGLFRLKAEVIAKHYDKRTIMDLANVEYMQEPPELIAEAINLIKRPGRLCLRIKVKAESLAMMDYRRMQDERANFLTGLSSFLQASAPLLEQEPTTAPFLLQMLQWGMAGFRGADEIEGVVDAAIEAVQMDMQERQANPQPNPDVEKELAKAQGQVQLAEAKAQADMQVREHDLQADIQTAALQHDLKVQETEADFRQQLALIEAKAKADMAVEAHQSRVNAEQHAQGVEAELNKDIVEHTLSLDAEAEKTALAIRATQATEEQKRASEITKAALDEERAENDASRQREQNQGESESDA